jgi:hypothetical protein
VSVIQLKVGMEFVNVKKKITSRVEFLRFFYYLCAMDNLKNFIVKNKYDLLSLGCVCLMFSVSAVFAIPSLVFLVIGASKSEH